MATLGLRNSRRREQHAWQLQPKAAYTLVSQFLGIFRRNFCCVLLRFSDRGGSSIPFLSELHLCLLFRHTRKMLIPESLSLYAQGAGIRTARRAYEGVSSRDTYIRHWFCSMATHLLLPSAEAPAGKAGAAEFRRVRNDQAPDDAPSWLAPTHPLQPLVLTPTLRSSRRSRPEKKNIEPQQSVSVANCDTWHPHLFSSATGECPKKKKHTARV